MKTKIFHFFTITCLVILSINQQGIAQCIDPIYTCQCEYEETGSSANCQCPDGQAPGVNGCELLPDLTVSHWYLQNFSEETADGTEIRVATALANIGDGPIEVIGTGEVYCLEVPGESCLNSLDIDNMFAN